MSKTDTIPTPDDIIGPAIDAIVAVRPRALDHLNNGADSRYADIIRAWRAQAGLAIDRLADEYAQRFVRTATGDGLRDLVAEPDFGSLNLDEAPTRAYGVAVLHRSLIPPNITLPPGIIPVGTRFKRDANPAAVPLPLPAGEWESTEPVVCDAAANSVSIPVRAVRTGISGNVVPESGVTGSAGVTIASRLYDQEQNSPLEAKWAIFSFEAGGGSSGLTDDDVRRIARGQAGGLAGPTDAAIVAWAHRGSGVRHLAVFDSMVDDDNATRPNSRVFIADESWSSSALWRSAVVQFLSSNACGFGCRVTGGAVSNVYVRVSCTIQLRSANRLTDTSAISAACRDAIRAYFDDRPNFYEWSLGGLRAAISNASREILTCTAATVMDRYGVALAAPTVDKSSAMTIAHYYLLGDGFTPTFTGPA